MTTVQELDHLSYSSLSAFLLCGRRWRYHYLDRVPSPGSPSLAFGTAWHRTVEDHIRERSMGRTPRDPAEAWDEHWAVAAAEEIDWGGETPQQHRNQGHRMLATAEIRALLDTFEPLMEDGAPVIERRVELRVPGVPIPLIGYVDVVRAADGVPCDFKTAGRAWTEQQADEEIQPIVYLAAMNQTGSLGNPEHRFRHIVFTKTREPRVQVIETRRTAADMLWLAEAIREAWRAISAGHFVPNPRSCFAYGRRCEFWERCRGRG